MKDMPVIEIPRNVKVVSCSTVGCQIEKVGECIVILGPGTYEGAMHIINGSTVFPLF